jgi:5'-nucleotidase
VHAVVTNDDGIGSEGLRMLAGAAVRAGWDVVVAAPDRQASGSGAAMTAVQADGQVVVERHRLPGIETVPAYAVQAAPGFIAFTAVRGAFGRRPDYLLSGINLGPNTGQAVLHSGTVGAAMTAATHAG